MEKIISSVFYRFVLEIVVFYRDRTRLELSTSFFAVDFRLRCIITRIFNQFWDCLGGLKDQSARGRIPLFF